LRAQFAVKKLIPLIREEALRNNYSRITGIQIRLGAQENINEKDLFEAFNEFRDSPLIKNADIIVKKSKVLARCRYCGCIFEVFYFNNRCGQCGCTYLEFVTDRGINLEKVVGEK